MRGIGWGRLMEGFEEGGEGSGLVGVWWGIFCRGSG